MISSNNPTDPTKIENFKGKIESFQKVEISQLHWNVDLVYCVKHTFRKFSETIDLTCMTDSCMSYTNTLLLSSFYSWGKKSSCGSTVGSVDDEFVLFFILEWLFSPFMIQFSALEALIQEKSRCLITRIKFGKYFKDYTLIFLHFYCELWLQLDSLM